MVNAFLMGYSSKIINDAQENKAMREVLAKLSHLENLKSAFLLLMTAVYALYMG
ncbi:hypothetical protein HX889_37150 [Pseudomonas reactans]|nr:hypothetical protein [Pseudomonas reactans]